MAALLTLALAWTPQVSHARDDRVVFGYDFRHPLVDLALSADSDIWALVAATLETELFRRQARVRQTGVVYKVHPGMTHTRAPHAMGTLWNTLYVLGNNMNRGIRVEPDAVINSAYAALAHDKTHMFASHDSEQLFKRLGKGGDVRYGHETYLTKALEMELPVLLKYGGATVVDVQRRIRLGWQGPHVGLSTRLVSGTQGTDQLHYGPEDAYRAGYPVDLIRRAMPVREILDNYVIVNGRLVLHEDGVPAVIRGLVANDAMYCHVYRALGARAAAIQYTEVMQRLDQVAGDPRILASGDPLARFLQQGERIELDEFMQLDDAYVDRRIRTYLASPDRLLREATERFLKPGLLPDGIYISALDLNGGDVLEEVKDAVRSIAEAHGYARSRVSPYDKNVRKGYRGHTGLGGNGKHVAATHESIEVGTKAGDIVPLEGWTDLRPQHKRVLDVLWQGYKGFHLFFPQSIGAKARTHVNAILTTRGTPPLTPAEISAAIAWNGRTPGRRALNHPSLRPHLLRKILKSRDAH